MKAMIRQCWQYLQQAILKIWRFVCQKWDTLTVIFLCLCLLSGGFWYGTRYTSKEELSIRNHIIRVAESYLGYREDDGTHREIVDIYNSHEPRARGYEVTYEDSWCAVFSSTVALQSDMFGWIPLECSCEQQIILFNEMDCWVEKDCYLPQTGDYIYYDWNSKGNGDCTGWSDHVGIVVQTFGPAIKVIEGNKDDEVSYRYIFVNDSFIRGFGLPDYTHYSEIEH